VFERFSEHGRQVIVLAQDEARSLGHRQIGSEHLLLGLVRQDDDLFELLGDPADLRARVVELVGHGDSASPDDLRFSEHATAALRQVAVADGPMAGPHELAIAVLSLPDGATALQALRAHGVSPAAARDEIAAIRAPAGPSHDEPAGLSPASQRVLETAARHAEDVPVEPEHILLALVLEVPDLAGRTLGVADGQIVMDRLARVLDGPQRQERTAGGRGIAVIESALRNAEQAGKAQVTPEDILLGLLEVGPDIVARAAIDLALMEASIRAQKTSDPDEPSPRLHRFSQAARNAIVRAQEEARLLDHAYVGTEHLLLALIRDEHGAAGRVLADLRVDLDVARVQVERVVVRGGAAPAGGDLPFSSHAKRVLQLALHESFRNTDIDTGHLLLAIERDGGGVAVLLLERFSVSRGLLRRATLAMLGHEPMAMPAPDPAPSTRGAFVAAEDEAAALGQHWVGCEHLLIALIRQGGRVAAALLTLGVTLGGVSGAVRDLGRGDLAIEPYRTARLVRVVELAERLAQAEGRPQADGENLVIALARESVGVARELLGPAADEGVLRRALGAH
jgi:ATP-dependent Clp protease ATP-binding subunit ClpA